MALGLLVFTVSAVFTSCASAQDVGETELQQRVRSIVSRSIKSLETPFFYSQGHIPSSSRYAFGQAGADYIINSKKAPSDRGAGVGAEPITAPRIAPSPNAEPTSFEEPRVFVIPYNVQGAQQGQNYLGRPGLPKQNSEYAPAQAVSSSDPSLAHHHTTSENAPALAQHFQNAPNNLPTEISNTSPNGTKAPVRQIYNFYRLDGDDTTKISSNTNTNHLTEPAALRRRSPLLHPSHHEHSRSLPLAQAPTQYNSQFAPQSRVPLAPHHAPYAPPLHQAPRTQTPKALATAHVRPRNAPRAFAPTLNAPLTQEASGYDSVPIPAPYEDTTTTEQPAAEPAQGYEQAAPSTGYETAQGYGPASGYEQAAPKNYAQGYEQAAPADSFDTTTAPPPTTAPKRHPRPPAPPPRKHAPAPSKPRAPARSYESAPYSGYDAPSDAPRAPPLATTSAPSPSAYEQAAYEQSAPTENLPKAPKSKPAASLQPARRQPGIAPPNHHLPPSSYEPAPQYSYEPAPTRAPSEPETTTAQTAYDAEAPIYEEPTTTSTLAPSPPPRRQTRPVPPESQPQGYDQDYTNPDRQTVMAFPPAFGPPGRNKDRKKPNTKQPITRILSTTVAAPAAYEQPTEEPTTEAAPATQPSYETQNPYGQQPQAYGDQSAYPSAQPSVGAPPRPAPKPRRPAQKPHPAPPHGYESTAPSDYYAPAQPRPRIQPPKPSRKVAPFKAPERHVAPPRKPVTYEPPVQPSYETSTQPAAYDNEPSAAYEPVHEPESLPTEAPLKHETQPTQPTYEYETITQIVEVPEYELVYEPADASQAGKRPAPAQRSRLAHHKLPHPRPTKPTTEAPAPPPQPEHDTPAHYEQVAPQSNSGYDSQVAPEDAEPESAATPAQPESGSSQQESLPESDTTEVYEEVEETTIVIEEVPVTEWVAVDAYVEEEAEPADGGKPATTTPSSFELNGAPVADSGAKTGSDEAAATENENAASGNETAEVHPGSEDLVVKQSNEGLGAQNQRTIISNLQSGRPRIIVSQRQSIGKRLSELEKEIADEVARDLVVPSIPDAGAGAAESAGGIDSATINQRQEQGSNQAEPAATPAGSQYQRSSHVKRSGEYPLFMDPRTGAFVVPQFGGFQRSLFPWQR